jgi:hypothetical protein
MKGVDSMPLQREVDCEETKHGARIKYSLLNFCYSHKSFYFCLHKFVTMQQQLELLKTELNSTRKAVGTVIHLLEKINTVVEEGFETVNKRLSNLEGRNGMQGVNEQLGSIKTELQKIQKAYPYDDLIHNMDQITGKA